MTANQISTITTLTVAVLCLCSCGQDPDNRENAAGQSSVLNDTSLQTGAVNVALTETLESLSDSNPSSSSTELTLSSFNLQADVSRTRACEQNDTQTTVTISRQIDREWSRDGQRISRSRQIEGAGSLTRTWSHPDRAISCRNNTHADIVWDESIADTVLKVSFSRSRDMQSSITFKNRDLTRERSFSFAAEGSRTITWQSHTDNDDNTYTRVKSIASEVERSHTRPNEAGSATELNYNIKTATGQPLQVSVTRDDSTHEPLTKTISSGQLIATQTNNGRTETSFADFTIKFATDSCQPESGTITVKFYDSNDEHARKTFQLQADSGSYTLTDKTDPDSPEEIEDFEYTACSMADFSL
jgi:hypothetical protein